MREDLDVAVLAAAREVLGDLAGPAAGDFGHWRPDDAGGWSSPVARRLSAASGMPVVPLAARLAAGLGERLGAVEVVGDGFLVVRPGQAELRAVVTTVLATGAAYGRPNGPVSPLVVNPAVPQRRTPGNPLFVVMWAHARCSVLLDRATGDAVEGAGAPDPTTAERILVLRLADPPRAVAGASNPATVLRRVHEVAEATHRWLDERDDPGKGWPDLVAAARQVLATGLDLLGLPAPARF